MYLSSGLKSALFAATESKFYRVGRSSRFGQGCSSRSVKSVRFGQLVPSDVGLSLRPSSLVGLSLRPSSLVGLSHQKLATPHQKLATPNQKMVTMAKKW